MKINLLISILFLNLLTSCQIEKEYPKLSYNISSYRESINDTNLVIDIDSRMLYSAYKDVTTKDSVFTKKKDKYYKIDPWSNKISLNKAKSILSQIESTIIAKADFHSEYNHEPFNNIRFESIIEISEKESLEFEKNRDRTNILDLSNVKVTLINYNLRNEKNEKISFFSNENIGKGTYGPSNNNQIRIELNTLNNDNSQKYSSLDGFVELEIEISTKYEKIEISNIEVGNTLNIGNQKVKILEFDGNAFHFKLIDEVKPQFKILIDKYHGFGGVILSEEAYNIFRANQELGYNEFLKVFNKFEIDDKNINNIHVYKSKISNIKKVLFYYSKDSNKVKKLLKIPINIKID